MNALQNHSTPSYPRPIISGLVISLLSLLVLDIYLMLKYTVRDSYVFIDIEMIRRVFLNALPRDSYVILRIRYFFSVIFILLLVFYIVRLVVANVSKNKQVDKTSRLRDSDTSLTITNFLTYRRNGITVYHLFTLLLLILHFISGYIYIYREFTVGGYGPIEFLYFLFTVSIMTIIVVTFALIFLKDKLQLESLPTLLNRLLPLLIILAFFTLFFGDIIGLFLSGIIFTYPLLVLSLLKINHPSSLSLNTITVSQSNSNKISKSIILVIAVSIFMLMFSFYLISTQTSFYHQKQTILNFENLLYITLILCITLLTSYFSRTFSRQKTEKFLFSTTIITASILVINFMYDNFYFAVERLGYSIGLRFFNNFLLIFLPTSVLTGFLISFGAKLSKSNKDSELQYTTHQ